MLEPGWNEALLAQAFIRVSCTRSSARAVRPQSDMAKARRLGTAARRSSLTLGSIMNDPPFCVRVPQAVHGNDPARPRSRPPHTRRATGGRYVLVGPLPASRRSPARRERGRLDRERLVSLLSAAGSFPKPA